MPASAVSSGSSECPPKAMIDAITSHYKSGVLEIIIPKKNGCKRSIESAA